MWVHLTGALSSVSKIIVYEYQKTRHRSHLQEYYKDFNGILMTNGLEQYHKLSREKEGLINANCFAHAIINTDVVINRGCIVNLGAIVDHRCIIDEGVHVCLGAIVKGENHLPRCIKIDAGQIVERGSTRFDIFFSSAQLLGFFDSVVWLS